MKSGLATTRIISGFLGGRTLVLPVSEGLRPSKNRVTQAVFNMLESRVDWDGMVVADLCCGSGAWGLEALSRGCAKVYLVDQDVAAVAANVRLLGLEGDARVVVVQADVRGWAPPEALDVVLCDPPYDSTLAAAMVARNGTLGGAIWVLEHDAAVAVDLGDGWEVVRRVYGKSGITMGLKG